MVRIPWRDLRRDLSSAVSLSAGGGMVAWLQGLLMNDDYPVVNGGSGSEPGLFIFLTHIPHFGAKELLKVSQPFDR